MVAQNSTDIFSADYACSILTQVTDCGFILRVVLFLAHLELLFLRLVTNLCGCAMQPNVVVKDGRAQTMMFRNAGNPSVPPRVSPIGLHLARPRFGAECQPSRRVPLRGLALCGVATLRRRLAT